ncbi:MAG: hypothetical protein IPL39_15020 [Opitutaceae bacterium]|nr:hypothetical protein [Opitutaceae bacterium]
MTPKLRSLLPSFCLLLLGVTVIAAEPAAPYWLPATNHWAGNTGGKGGITGDVISNMVVDIAVLNAGQLGDEFKPYAPLVITKSYWDETNWGDGAYSEGKRVSKGEFFSANLPFDSTTRDALTATIAHPSPLSRDQRGREDQGMSIAAYPDNQPYVSFSDGRKIESIAYPTGLAFDHDGYLWVADNGPDQNFKIFTVPSAANEAPVLVATFGETGGVFAGPIRGAVGPRRFWGPRGVGFGEQGEIIVGCSGIPGQTQGGTDIRWFESSDTSSLAARLTTATQKHLALSTFTHVADFDPTSNGTSLHNTAIRYEMDYTKAPGQSWQFAAVTLDAFRFPDDPRLHMPLETAYYRIIGGKRFLFATSMAAGYMAIFRFEEGSEIAIPCGLFYCYYSGQGADWAAGKYPQWTASSTGWRYLWRDANGDGQVDTGEFSTFYVANSNSECYDVDADGNLWMGGGLSEYNSYFDGGGNWVIPCTGVGEHGVPIYALGAIEKLDVPSNLLLPQDREISRAPTRFRYLPATDTLFLGAGLGPWYTQRIYVLDGYRHSGQPTLRCMIDVGFDSNGQTEIHLDQGTELMVLPWSFAADNDYVYVATLTGGRDARARGEITIYSAHDGHEVGWLRPDPGANWFCGATDLVVGIQVATRTDGTRVICLEDNGGAKVMVYHWNPQDSGPAVQLQSVSIDQAQVNLVFGPTVSNRLYDVYASTDLAANTWTKLNTEPITGTGNNLEYVDTAAASPRKFYRLQIATPVAPTP